MPPEYFSTAMDDSEFDNSGDGDGDGDGDGPFQWVRPLSLHKITTIKLGSARLGLNLPGKGEAVLFCGVHFFGIMAGGGILRHH